MTTIFAGTVSYGGVPGRGTLAFILLARSLVPQAQVFVCYLCCWPLRALLVLPYVGGVCF
jgi:hypothetical protein